MAIPFPKKSNPTTSPRAKAAKPATSITDDPVLQMKQRKARPGQYIYVARVRLGETSLTGLSLLLHEEQFSAAEFEDKLTEATRTTNETRLVHRRREMAAKHTPVPDPQETNERLFQSDVDFLEMVMADKFGFQVLTSKVADASIEPTVKIS